MSRESQSRFIRPSFCESLMILWLVGGSCRRPIEAIAESGPARPCYETRSSLGARGAAALRQAPFQSLGEGDAKFVKSVRLGQDLQAVVLDLLPERTGMAACKNDRQLR